MAALLACPGVVVLVVGVARRGKRALAESLIGSRDMCAAQVEPVANVLTVPGRLCGATWRSRSNSIRRKVPYERARVAARVLRKGELWETRPVSSKTWDA